MKQTKPLLAATAIALSSLFSGLVVAQTSPDQHTMELSAKPGLTDGEVRKIDKEAGKLTLRHGEIKHLDMPPMTMAYKVKDAAWLDQLKAGQKIRFITDPADGGMTVLRYELAK